MRLQLPEGWRVEGEERGSVFMYAVYDGERKWPSGEPRSVLEVTLYPPRDGLLGRGPEISWPSTSDKRPELAVALAYALGMAALYVDRADGYFARSPVELELYERRSEREGAA